MHDIIVTNKLKLTSVQTLCNCGGVDEITCTKVADDVFVKVLDLYLHLLLLGTNEARL